MSKRRILILGAAGRDFHDFCAFFKDNEDYRVVCFTQSTDQNIGEVDGGVIREFPVELAGELYNKPIPIYPEERLEELIEQRNIDEVVFSYSDISHNEVMHRASRALSSGASFRLIGPKEMMLESKLPVIAIDAVRTGIGKSQVSRKIVSVLKEKNLNPIVVREPMPYGDLKNQEIQRFDSFEDLDKHDVTIEEREEYEKHIRKGNTVYAGINYEKILREVEKEADVVIWEGGNNELPFFKPDLHMVLADPHRPGHEITYHPGETNLRLADFVLINKENTAKKEDIKTIEKNVGEVNPDAVIIHADSIVSVENPNAIQGKRALVIEDGPTLTHGGTRYGAGWVAAEKYRAKEVVDPREGAVGTIKQALEKYSEINKVLPAMGYSDEQITDLEETINNLEFDVIISASPFDLKKVVKTEKPIVNVIYELKEKNIKLEEIISDFLKKNI